MEIETIDVLKTLDDLYTFIRFKGKEKRNLLPQKISWIERGQWFKEEQNIDPVLKEKIRKISVFFDWCAAPYGRNDLLPFLPCPSSFVLDGEKLKEEIISKNIPVFGVEKQGKQFYFTWTTHCGIFAFDENLIPSTQSASVFYELKEIIKKKWNKVRVLASRPSPLKIYEKRMKAAISFQEKQMKFAGELRKQIRDLEEIAKLCEQGRIHRKVNDGLYDRCMKLYQSIHDITSCEPSLTGNTSEETDEKIKKAIDGSILVKKSSKKKKD